MVTAVRAADVRRRFIEFFEFRGHTHVASSPVVPVDDPTLLFTNAGMNQFKPVFQGDVPAGSPLAGLRRAVNSQKCIRAGGKHNDLEDVGRDTYHHTFFEMLGNWSFGDYFKKESIDWAWEFLTGELGLDGSRLYATYFGGDAAAGLPADEEARTLWLRHLPAERVLPGTMKDNFWEMGETGPCGPCSELHYDRVGGRDARALVNADSEEVIEIWNLVFIQFDRQTDGALKTLPDKHVDTGMGLERLVSVLSGMRSNYDTDLFLPLFAEIERLTGARPYSGRFGERDAGGVDTAYRVIADHARALTFALADGAVPSNEGRGYVLRRILRRAVRFGRQRLGAKSGFFSSLVPVLARHMGEAFPEVAANENRVRALMLEEEESFGRTLDRGIKLFEEIAAALAAGAVISGADAFKLYDTFGFPLDLTQLMASERGLTVDADGFGSEMARQKERSRAGAKGGGERGLGLDAEAIASLRHMGVRETDDSFKFAGRDMRAHVRAIWNGRDFDEHADTINTGGGRRVGVVVDRTPFYAEMGGQVADTGQMSVSRETKRGPSGGGGEFRVEDVQNYGGFVLHIGRAVRGEVRVGDDVTLHVDHGRRRQIAANHTATHLLNRALRDAVNPDADQRGSLVAEDRLRFDFSNAGPVTPERLGEVEARVRRDIAADLPVHADLAPLVEAREIRGLRAVFGETYPDPVRVVSIGAPVADLLASPEDDAWERLSVEFCGGTHLGSTGEAGEFAVVSEEAVAKGIRRVTALTGVAAQAAHAAADAMAARIGEASALAMDRLVEEHRAIAAEIDELTLPAARRAALRAEAAALGERVKSAAKEAAAQRASEAARLASALADSAERSLDPYFVSTIDAGSDRSALQAALHAITQRVPRTPVMLLSADASEGRVSVIAAVPKDAIGKGLKAGDWVRETAAVVGGKGGGKPDMAQGGGTEIAKVREAVEAARRFAGGKLL